MSSLEAPLPVFSSALGLLREICLERVGFVCLQACMWAGCLAFCSVLQLCGLTDVQTFSLLPVSSRRETDFKHPGKGGKKMGICLTERPDGSLPRLPTSFLNVKTQEGNV